MLIMEYHYVVIMMARESQFPVQNFELWMYHVKGGGGVQITKFRPKADATRETGRTQSARLLLLTENTYTMQPALDSSTRFTTSRFLFPRLLGVIGLRATRM